jgi:hypothetical protein
MRSDVIGASILACHPQHFVYRWSVLTVAAEEDREDWQVFE